MIATAKLALLLASSAAGVWGDFVAPEYDLNMDADAYARWKPIYDKGIAEKGYNVTWGPFHDYLMKMLNEKEWGELEGLMAEVFEAYPPMYQEEIKAAKQWLDENGHKEWSMTQLTMVQLFYEVEDACTSIVAQNTNSSIYHSRNLDYNLPSLSTFTATLNVYSKGQKTYKSSVFLGYLGVLTGQHREPSTGPTWAISLNQRFYGKHWVPYVDTIKAIKAGVQNVGFVLRDSLSQYRTFTEAAKGMQEVKIPAPAYLIISGTENNEGVVISRDRNGTSNALGTGRGYWALDAGAGGNSWYRLETNFDNWEPLNDGRRPAAHASMDAIGQAAVDSHSLLEALSKPPVLAKTTTYTASMFNAGDYYQTYVRTQSPSDSVRDAILAQAAKDTRAKLEDLLAWNRQRLTNKM